MSEIAIRAGGVGKRYQLGAIDSYKTLRDTLTDAIKAPFRRLSSGPRARGTAETIWALKDVGFEVKHGEVVGIIGRNGAGKSTLLKVLSRITEPTEGRVEIHGRVGSLLEVGTGFHPELSGRENIFLNGAILGMKKAEIMRKFDEIVAFAEVERFVDTAVKHYSSGMHVRLAFAVAAHLDPEILIVDEVLAVGDAAFQKKCLAKMDDVAGKGRTILFVSHNMQTVQQLCSRAILFGEGRKLIDGETGNVVQRYLQNGLISQSLKEVARVIETLPPDDAFRLERVDIIQNDQSGTEVISGKEIEILIQYEVSKAVIGLHVWISFFDLDGTLLFESLHNGDSQGTPSITPGRYVSRAIIPANFLADRTYEVEINAAIHNVRVCLPHPSPIRLPMDVVGVGLVNRAYPGYVSPGKLAPLIPWETEYLGTPGGTTESLAVGQPDDPFEIDVNSSFRRGWKAKRYGEWCENSNSATRRLEETNFRPAV